MPAGRGSRPAWICASESSSSVAGQRKERAVGILGVHDELCHQTDGLTHRIFVFGRYGAMFYQLPADAEGSPLSSAWSSESFVRSFSVDGGALGGDTGSCACVVRFVFAGDGGCSLE